MADDPFADEKYRNPDQQSGQYRFRERKNKDALFPAAQVLRAQLTADIHQNQRQGNIGNQFHFLERGLGNQRGDMDQLGKGWTNQQPGEQIAGNTRNTAEHGQASPRPGH